MRRTLTENATCLSASRATFATFGRGLVKKQGRPTSGSADTTRSCDPRSLRGAKACGDAGKLRLVSTFDESTNFWADRRDLCREFEAIFSREILSHGKSLRVPSGLICLFASMAEALP